ncbi:MAG: hypothetical protein AAFY88_22560, partial [Acidobacteriota bacterium]
MNREYLSGLVAILCALAIAVFGAAAPSGAERLIVEPESSAWSSWVVLGARDISVKKDTLVEGDVHAGGNLDQI